MTHTTINTRTDLLPYSRGNDIIISHAQATASAPPHGSQAATARPLKSSAPSDRSVHAAAAKEI